MSKGFRQIFFRGTRVFATDLRISLPLERLIPPSYQLLLSTIGSTVVGFGFSDSFLDCLPRGRRKLPRRIL